MYRLPLILCLLLQGCALFQRTARPAHASPEEASQVQFPRELPAAGLQELSGPMAAAIALAMDDFRPLGTHPHRDATPLEQCLYRREAFNVAAAPGPNGWVFVRFSFSPANCAEHEREIVLDMGATYAVDVAGARILAIQP
ncbi:MULTISPECIES: hypothetical protein [Corallococcus]|uniref:hypothetical protein n=1 Tax=Corallococcus TaxID=83461 RepID=UPI00117CF310|nr:MULTISPECIES: hypothetical protein [Corallococcus]NBD12243.1 hypothetical protein [Corallococcus silvisoli]TSC25198.1 hypothetical protein FOF48_25020 [Corallococcus sp. Z5C101001]